MRRQRHSHGRDCSEPLHTILVDQAAAHSGPAMTTRFKDKMTKHGGKCGVHPPGSGDNMGLGGASGHPGHEVGSCSCQEDWTGRVGQDQTCIPESGLRPGRFYFSTHALHIVIL